MNNKGADRTAKMRIWQKQVFSWRSSYVVMVCFQAYLSSTDFGTTEDQVEALIRKHEAFEKVLAVQEEKVFVFLSLLYFYSQMQAYIVLQVWNSMEI